LKILESTANLEHLSLAEILCFAFVTLGALAPRRLGVAQRASNRVVSRWKFVQVALRLHKGRSKLSELGKWLEKDPAWWK
jgi:hypothetical protein